MPDEVYKVVRSVPNGKLERKLSASAMGCATVIYEAGKWTEAPKHLAQAGYHLLAFYSLEKALAFTHRGFAPPGLEVWRTQAEGRMHPLPPMVSPLRLIDEANELIPWDINWPDGTVMYQRIKLVERIDES